VSAGLGEGAPGDEHPRPGNEPLPLSFPESGIRPAGIPYGGKTLIQGFLDDPDRADHQHGRMVQPLLLHDVGIDRAQMDMAIDEPGKQGLIPAIDRLGIRGNSPRSTRQNLLDPIIFHHHRPIGNGIGARPVDDGCVLEDQNTHRLLLSSSRRTAAANRNLPILPEPVKY
jgi:hypothetical protein